MYNDKKKKTDLTSVSKETRLDGNTIEELKDIVKQNLAPYLQYVNVRGNLRLSTAYYSRKRNVQWFGFPAECPICHNENESGYCMVGIEADKPFEISFRCRRYSKAITYKEESKGNKSKEYVEVPMGQDISDVYVLTYKSNDSSYWARDAKRSQSKLKSKYVTFKHTKIYDAKEAPEAYQDIMNKFVLGKYKLSRKHLANLKKRGFTDEDLSSFPRTTGFGSFTWKIRQYNDEAYREHKNGSYSIWRRALALNSNILAKAGISQKRISNLWFGVPGFYLRTVKLGEKITQVPFYNGLVGMLVPYYNVNNQLIRFQVRLDKPNLKHVKVDEIDENFDILKDGKSSRVEFPKGGNGRDYEVYVDTLGEDNPTLITKGKITKLNSWIDVTKKLHEAGYTNKYLKFTISGKEDQKYYWISSKGKINKSEGKIYGVDPNFGAPVEVAYQPKVAKLRPNSAELKSYQNKPKNVWVTEGGLKSLLAVRKLEKNFSQKELDVYGHDVLGVPGTKNIGQLFEVLASLNVQNVTLAYDMDMFTANNMEVANDLFTLAEKLLARNYGVRIAVWNGNVGKGLDDILVSNNCYMKFKNLKIK